MKVLRSAEVVGRGHPDKIADLISDTILDHLVSKLGVKNVRFAGEVLVSFRKIFLAGEGSSLSNMDLWKIVSKVLADLHYDSSKFEFFEDYKTQSQELLSLNHCGCTVAGDQGIVFGYASNQNHHYLPLEHTITKEISLKLSEVIKNKTFPGLKEDYKILLNLEVDTDDAAEKINSAFLKTIVISIHHDKNFHLTELENFLKKEVVCPILRRYNVVDDENTQWLVNPSGSFLIGGLEADSGVTNRKQISDLYGASVRHGGGGLSGKDLTKIDRLGAYYLRWIAKNIVSAGLASEIEIKATFSIAKSEALSFDISQSQFCKLNSAKELNNLIFSCFPTKISEIFDYFTSVHFSFAELCSISHFGEFISNLPWEQLNKVTDIDAWRSERIRET